MEGTEGWGSGLCCRLEVWNGFSDMVHSEYVTDLKAILGFQADYRKEAILYAARHGCGQNMLYSVTQHDEMLDIITTISLFKNTPVTDDEIDELIRRFPSAEFGIIYAKRNKNLCMEIWREEKSRHIGPITLREANEFVKAHHRHHDSVTGCRFAVGLYKTVRGKDVLIGTAICGRPVSRALDDGYTLEVNRLCVTERGNSCSMLYGACSRIAREMGYRKVITYILESESGTSLRGSNFVLEDECCGAPNWTGKRRRKDNTVPEEMKQRWAKVLSG